MSQIEFPLNPIDTSRGLELNSYGVPVTYNSTEVGKLSTYESELLDMLSDNQYIQNINPSTSFNLPQVNQPFPNLLSTDDLKDKCKAALDYIEEYCKYHKLNIFFSVLKKYGFIAGGFLRDNYVGVIPKDIDIFFSEKETVESLREELEGKLYFKITPLGNYEISFPNENNLVFPKVQLITFSVGDIAEVIGRFDFKQNQIAYRLNDGELFFADTKWFDKTSRKSFMSLEVNSQCLNPLSALVRATKMVQRNHGWDINDNNEYKLAQMIQGGLEEKKKEIWLNIVHS